MTLTHVLDHDLFAPITSSGTEATGKTIEEETMGFRRSQADILAEWSLLLSSTEEDPRRVGAGNRAELVQLLARARELAVEQAQHQAARQIASEALRTVFARGEDVARDLKHELRGGVGSRSEELVRFGLQPLREGGGRPRRAKAEASPAVLGSETPTQESD